jgi:malate synthase
VTILTVTAPRVERDTEILTTDALAFLGELHERFADRRDELMLARVVRREQIRETGLGFRADTATIRAAEWQVAPAPLDLVDRRVEITGPTERKMAINALNSGAKVWLADLEDANTPHWRNVIGGQVNLADAVRQEIALSLPDGRRYELRADRPLATIVVRPRGWHLDERHLRHGARSAVGALVDFGLYFFHNAAELIRRGSGPYFYLPKMESHLEARLWQDVFTYAQERLSVPYGVIRATVLIETIPAAYEMDEILYELRDHASGLNAGRWDYLFSIIKKFRDAGPAFVLPDRAAVTMAAPFLRAYTDLLVKTCHRRGAYAIGGMAAFIPSRSDADVNAQAFAKVTEDKVREAAAGFDGSWVAHPDLVPVCEAVFDEAFAGRRNQLDVTRAGVRADADALLDLALPAPVTEAGLRTNVEVALRYLAAWLTGNGAVAIHHLMEDAATAEISRSQLWQWVHNATALDDGRTVTDVMVREILREESAAIEAEVGAEVWASGRFAEAAELFEQVALGEDFADFLTVLAYELID